MPKRDFRCTEEGADEWVIHQAYDAEEAAQLHAAHMDANSGGECFRDTMKDIVLVRVQCGDDSWLFEISFDWSKDFYSREIENADKA